jgi:hypothetical protein
MEPHQRAIAACAEFPNDNPGLHRGAIWRCVEIGGAAVCERADAPSRADGDAGSLESTLTEPLALAHAGPADDAVEDVAMLLAEVAAMVERAEAVEPVKPAAAVEDMAEVLHEAEQNDEHIDVVDDLAFDDAAVEGAPDEPTPDREETSGTDPFAVLVRVLEEVARGAGCPEDILVGLRVVLGAARVDGTLPRPCMDALLSAGMIEQGEHGPVRAEPLTRQVVAWQGVLRGESEDFGACGGAMLDEWCAGLLARMMGAASRVEGLRRELRGRGVAAFGLVADAAA